MRHVQRHHSQRLYIIHWEYWIPWLIWCEQHSQKTQILVQLVRRCKDSIMHNLPHTQKLRSQKLYIIHLNYWLSWHIQSPYVKIIHNIIRLASERIWSCHWKSVSFYQTCCGNTHWVFVVSICLIFWKKIWLTVIFIEFAAAKWLLNYFMTIWKKYIFGTVTQDELSCGEHNLTERHQLEKLG